MEDKEYMDLEIPGLVRQEEGYFDDEGKQVYECLLGIRKIVIYDSSGRLDEEYEPLVKIYGKAYYERLSLSRIKNRNFLSGYGILSKRKEDDYAPLRKAIFQTEIPEKYTDIETRRNGFQKVMGRWQFVFGNGSIDAGGFQSNITSRCGGAYVDDACIIEPEACVSSVEQLFAAYSKGIEFHIVFLTDIMSMTEGYCDLVMGEEAFMGLTLWLKGLSGSGKTEMAKAGLFLFTSEDRRRRPFSQNANKKDILLKLVQSSGSPCILDDVKHESGQRKQDGLNSVDDVIRSVFAGFLQAPAKGYPEYERIDCCAIITGEYLATKGSGTARILYWDMGGFLDDRCPLRITFSSIQTM